MPMNLTFNDNENSSIICIEINLNTDSYVKKISKYTYNKEL